MSEGDSDAYTFPACFPEVLSVGAVDYDADVGRIHLEKSKSRHSGRNAHTDCVAVGCKVRLKSTSFFDFYLNLRCKGHRSTIESKVPKFRLRACLQGTLLLILPHSQDNHFHEQVWKGIPAMLALNEIFFRLQVSHFRTLWPLTIPYIFGEFYQLPDGALRSLYVFALPHTRVPASYRTICLSRTPPALHALSPAFRGLHVP